MSARLRALAFSFQTKLVLALTAVIILAILIAGAVFVTSNRSDRRQQALDRVAAASPAIYQQTVYALFPRDANNDISVTDTLDALAEQQRVRILLLSDDGVVLHDTGGGLNDITILIPRSSVGDLQRGFIAWEPSADFPEHGITLVSASSQYSSGGRPLPFRIVLAVKTDTIAGAWLGILPSLLIAALIAVPIASIAGIALARQVAQPVQKLTAASEAMARGDFSQRVEVTRDDEVGRLARAFGAMSERVSLRDTQMRALLANVSHDLKTPMTSITGYAHALSDGTADDADIRRIGGVIADESAHVNSLLADLLYLAEIDAGEVLTAREDVPLEPIVSRCVRRLDPVAHAKGVDVQVDVASDALLHGVDPEKVERALTNVIDNAAKFTPRAGTIAISARCENGAGPARVVCRVSNTGAAIAEEELPRVFDRFFRGDRARRTANGSGLGLAISRELIELNGGAIAAENLADGVAFTVTLPAAS